MKSFNRRQFLKHSALALSGLSLSSCGWTLADVGSSPGVSGSRDELYIYTWAGYTDNELLERFREETGIRVIADVFDSNESMLARLQAGGGGAYSLIYPSEYMVQQMMGLGMLQELDLTKLQGLESLFPRFANPRYDPGNRHSIPMSWGTTGLVYNRTKLAGIPEDWDYLWDNQQDLLRRMTLLNDLREVMGASLRSLGYSYNSQNRQEIESAYLKLKDLQSAIASFTSDAWRNQILTGDLHLAMCYSADANEVMEESEDLEYVLPLSGSSLWIDTLAIPKTAPNSEGAYAWINFMMQPDVAAKICERLSFATPSQSAFELLPQEIQTNHSLFPPEEALERCEGLEPVEEDISEVYDHFWTLLTSG